MNILFLGKEFLGSNARGLAEGFRKLDHTVYIINDDYYFPPMRTSLANRAIIRLLKPIFIKEYNAEVLAKDKLISPDLIIVAKGPFLSLATLKELKSRGRKCILFYPDTGFFAFGPRIPQCVPLFDKVFTTKPNLPNYIAKTFKADNAIFMPHAADSDLHRLLPPNNSLSTTFSCDVSFIGDWSLKKEKFLSALIDLNPKIDLKIWGPRWKSFSKCANLEKFIQGSGVFGDLYVNAIKYSKINLAILYEGHSNAPNGDVITSRTFHIPACGGFMLHERTSTLLEYFKEEIEISCFNSVEECSKKIEYYLKNEEEREKIKIRGYIRAHKENLMEHRAQFILDNINVNE